MRRAFRSINAVRSVSAWRGRLLSGFGVIGSQYEILFFVTLWFCSLMHFLRTGAMVSLVSGVVALLIAGIFEPSLFALCLVFPVLLTAGFLLRRRLALPVFMRLRAASDSDHRTTR